MAYKEVILVTGGLGFIGSHFIELLLEKGHRVINIDKITYASNLEIGEKFLKDYPEQYTFIQKDINDLEDLPFCDYIVHFAAESHVDNVIKDSTPFIKSNVLGTYHLLQLLLKPAIINKMYAWEQNLPTFIYISTDEVFGDIPDGFYKEDDRHYPSNPYSASKAAAELFVKSWARTYGINYKITRTTNNYGERQHPEKLIPHTITNILRDKKIPIHGHGHYIRNWIYVKDNCEAIYDVMKNGEINSCYHISSDEEFSVIDIVKMILEAMEKPFSNNYIQYIQNRTGQDVRYALDNSKIKALGWKQKVYFKDYIKRIIDYYKECDMSAEDISIQSAHAGGG